MTIRKILIVCFLAINQSVFAGDYVDGQSGISSQQISNVVVVEISNSVPGIVSNSVIPLQESLTYVSNNVTSLSGGTNGQIMIKNSSNDYDISWVNSLNINPNLTLNTLKTTNETAGVSQIQVGSSKPFYLLANWPTLGFNAFWKNMSEQWCYGAGDGDSYGAWQGFNPNSGEMSYRIASCWTIWNKFSSFSEAGFKY